MVLQARGWSCRIVTHICDDLLYHLWVVLLARGTLERAHSVVHLMVEDLEDVSSALGAVSTAVREFH